MGKTIGEKRKELALLREKEKILMRELEIDEVVLEKEEADYFDYLERIEEEAEFYRK